MAVCERIVPSNDVETTMLVAHHLYKLRKTLQDMENASESLSNVALAEIEYAQWKRSLPTTHTRYLRIEEEEV